MLKATDIQLVNVRGHSSCQHYEFSPIFRHSHSGISEDVWFLWHKHIQAESFFFQKQPNWHHLFS